MPIAIDRSFVLGVDHIKPFLNGYADDIRNVSGKMHGEFTIVGPPYPPRDWNWSSILVSTPDSPPDSPDSPGRPGIRIWLLTSIEGLYMYGWTLPDDQGDYLFLVSNHVEAEGIKGFSGSKIDLSFDGAYNSDTENLNLNIFGLENSLIILERYSKLYLRHLKDPGNNPKPSNWEEARKAFHTFIVVFVEAVRIVLLKNLLSDNEEARGVLAVIMGPFLMELAHNWLVISKAVRSGDFSKLTSFTTPDGSEIDITQDNAKDYVCIVLLSQNEYKSESSKKSRDGKNGNGKRPGGSPQQPKDQTPNSKKQTRRKSLGGSGKSVSGSYGVRNVFFVEKAKDEEEDDEDLKTPSRRPDLKAITKMRTEETALNPIKRLGHVPGVGVGDQFFSRAEMVVIGLHSHWLHGIDYTGKKYEGVYEENTFPLVTCIVLSGQYEDDVDNADIITCTGRGGHDLLGNKKQIYDQKLERGNLALKVIKTWDEIGKIKFKVYKYRVEGQKQLTTSQVRFVREDVPQSIADLQGMVSEDISNGLENIQIPATNSVDEPYPPSDFVYTKELCSPSEIKIRKNETGCKCRGDCESSPDCPCAKLNGNDFAYVRCNGGRLVEAKSIVFECGANCKCGPDCINRTSQNGIRYRLEVFKTPTKGWAVRSWDKIPGGSPLCEYTGVLKHADDVGIDHSDNMYIFDIDCLQTMKGMDGREKRAGNIPSVGPNSEPEVPEYCIDDAAEVGSVARFINHSCMPNLFDKVRLFAADTIPPLQELTYDYGYAMDSVVGPDGKIKELACHCGAAECQKRLL